MIANHLKTRFMMDEVKLIEVIFCTKKRKGSGVDYDPIRVVTEVFSTDGQLIAENDPHGGFTLFDMIRFGRYLQREKIEAVNELTVANWQKGA